MAGRLIYKFSGSQPIKLVENSSKAASYEAGVYRIIATGIIIEDCEKLIPVSNGCFKV